jgi:hypothetical protein
MERDKNISRLIRESGLIRAPENFSTQVLEQIDTEPVKVSYKPLIGRGGRILIFAGVAAIIILSVMYGGEGSKFIDLSSRLSQFSWQLPEWNLNLEFLAGVNLSTGFVPGLVALFILVITDALFTRRRPHQS